MSLLPRGRTITDEEIRSSTVTKEELDTMLLTDHEEFHQKLVAVALAAEAWISHGRMLNAGGCTKEFVTRDTELREAAIVALRAAGYLKEQQPPEPPE